MIATKHKMAERIVLWPVDQLIPYEKNPRTHSAEQIGQLAASILEFGFVNPVLIDTTAGIIAGHGRLQAAKQLGLEQVPVVVLDYLTDAQKRAYVIADNKLALNAGWDESLLKFELTELELADFDVATLGFSEIELEKLLPNEDIISTGMPALPQGEKSDFQQMTFSLHNTQAEIIKQAISAAKKIKPDEDVLNTNSNGNAITQICEMFLENHANSQTD